MNGLAIREIQDGYEQGGLIYFLMDGKEMVLAIRERKMFDRYRTDGRSLKDYVNSLVSPLVYDAAKAIEELIPKADIPTERE